MEEHKRPWNTKLIIVPDDPEPELTGKERRLLEADIRYWRESSRRKDEEIKYKDNQIRGLKGHVTRLHSQLHRKGVYKQ